MKSEIILEGRETEMVEWKVCQACEKEKGIGEFPIVKNQKKLADGTKKYYEPKRRDVCTSCTYGKDSEQKKYKLLIENLTPALHPYLQLR